MNQPRVALVSGFWAQNIGNAFFNIGGKYILDTVFGEEQVQFVHDRPSYRTFYDQSKGDPDNYVKLHEMLDVEYVVLQGPMLTKTFPAIWGEAFKSFKERGIKVILLGAAFFKYTEEETIVVETFLKDYRPYLVSTRDSVSCGILNKMGLGIPIHDGVDSAFFVPRVFNPLRLRESIYCFCFDRFPEPSLNRDIAGDADVIDINGQDYVLSTPGIQSYLSHKGKSIAYLGHLLDFRKLPKSIGGVRIVRPEHRYVPHMTHKIYQHPNSVVSDETFTYFTLYANSSLTLSDRVHACVMTLAYGNPARLFTPSPRKHLFARLGLEAISEKVVTLDLEYLNTERNNQLGFLSEHLT